MIIRFFFLSGLVVMGVAAYFIVIQQPPTVQAPPLVSEVTRWQQEGILPSGELEENEELEHGIFDVPEADEEQLKIALENMGEMPGMNMGADSAMNMEGDSGEMNMAESTGVMDMASDPNAMNMAENSDGAMNMEGESGEMNMTQGTGVMDMASDPNAMNMAENSDSAMNMEGESGEMNMAEGTERTMMVAKCVGDSGLSFCPDNTTPDREISISMLEWEFDQLEIEVQAGEKIRFTVRNDGKTLHEFMFMTMPLMQAVTYRARRADWSLLEHEALFEKSLMLPGQELTFIVEIQQAGSWMFMCMLPYHMQMGMMGQIATPGAAMAMDM